MWRKSWRSVCREISPRVPASSTPVGPPPTTTKVSHGARRLSFGSRSAASKAKKIRLRISSASSMVLRPGATLSHSGWPKYECVAPVARMSVSYWIVAPSSSVSVRLSG
jgi:hypothetical protein